MSSSLTWQLLRPEHVDRVMAATDAGAVREVLLRADSETSAGYFVRQHVTEAQQEILLDMLFHLVRFAKAQRFAPVKLSTAVSLLHELHTQAMAAKANAQEALTLLEKLLVRHSTHRPPFFAAVFTPLEAKALSEYIMSTYLRQYKLYLFAFAVRSEMAVSCRALGAVNETLPVGAAGVPPLQRATPLDQWEARVAEQERQEAARRKADEEALEAARAAAEKRRQEEAAAPPVPTGLREQLELIKGAVAESSEGQLAEIEARVAALEAKVAADQKPSTAGKGTSRGSRAK